MAQRGMLPKIRKTAQAAQPVARPTIRPVRVTKAPPPPAPPRKFPSGVAPRGSHEQYEQPQYEQAHYEQPHYEQPYADPPEPREVSTKNGYEDPPTMSAHGSPMPTAKKSSPALPPPSSLQFDDETQMRQPDNRLIAASRHPAPALAQTSRHQDDETLHGEGARKRSPATIPYFPPRDEHADQQIRHEHHEPQHQPDIYDSLPSLEIRRPYDTYEAEFQERDPATQFGQRERERVHAEHYPAPVQHDAEQYEHAPQTEAMPQREGSGARERPRKQSSKRPRGAYDDSGERDPAYAATAFDQAPATKQPEPAPRYEEPVIPPAPRVPAGFIVGVQPIRAQGAAPSTAYDAPPTYQPPTASPSPRAMHAPVQAPMHQQAYGQQAYGTPSMQHGMHQQPNHQGMHRGHPAMAYAQPVVFPRPQQPVTTHQGQHGMHPVGHQLQEQPSSTSKTLRFAWFVFGVAFGIGFTFFASGVVPGLKREEPAPIASAAPSATFPPPAPILSNTPPPVQAPSPPVQAQAPAPPPVEAPPPPVLAPPPAAAPPPAPAATYAVTNGGITPGQLPAAKTQQVAPAPPPPRVAAAPPAPRTRRASAPSGGGSAPKALPNSGSVEAPDSDGASSSASASRSSEPAASAPAKTAAVPADLFGAALNP